MLQNFLFKIKDHRRAQGRRYQLGHILFFSVLAILSGGDNYRALPFRMGEGADGADRRA